MTDELLTPDLSDANSQRARNAPTPDAPAGDPAASEAATADAPSTDRQKQLPKPPRSSASGAGTLKAAGVRTSKPAPPSSKRRRPKETPVGSTATKTSTEETDSKPFDPAADLPMYREGMDWFVLRVASNKESHVRETLLRKVQIEGLDDRVGRIMVPTEKTKTLKGGKTKISETKLYPGYIFVEMKLESDGRIPQDVFFLIKETTGVGDFVGTAGRPTPMGTHEVEKMLFDSRRPEEAPTVKMEFIPGDYVTITEGPFESYEGTVDEVLPDKGLVRVLVTIFGRQAPIELEYWQIEKAD